MSSGNTPLSRHKFAQPPHRYRECDVRNRQYEVDYRGIKIPQYILQCNLSRTEPDHKENPSLAEKL
jgi:hypothetical protein